MDKTVKNLLRRMIENGGFIARGIYTEDPHYWRSNTSHSSSVVDMSVFNEMRRKGYIRQDRTGRYYPTDKGRWYAAPWYKRIFNVI